MYNEQRQLLIWPEQFRELARPVSVHVDDDEVAQFIRECEDVYIIPAIGWPTIKLATMTDPCTADWLAIYDDTFDAAVLLDGGEYNPGDGCDCGTDGETRYCNGLRKALAYFVYAKMLRNDGAIIARAGAMQHNDQYAYHVNDAELKRYDDTMNVAERYLGECLEYANRHNNKNRTARQTRCRIIAVGD
jgi:hypothetical protein